MQNLIQISCGPMVMTILLPDHDWPNCYSAALSIQNVGYTKLTNIRMQTSIKIYHVLISNVVQKLLAFSLFANRRTDSHSVYIAHQRVVQSSNAMVHGPIDPH